jgi:hypothetical protein
MRHTKCEISNRDSAKMAAAAALRSSSPVIPTRRMRWLSLRLHAARCVEAGKRDFLRDDRSGLLRWPEREREREREREHGACNERRAKEAALSSATAPHLLHRPHFRSTLFTGLSENSASRWLVFMTYSVALEVMPHSATSRATGDDTSTIMSWNSGV